MLQAAVGLGCCVEELEGKTLPGASLTSLEECLVTVVFSVWSAESSGAH